MAKGRVMAGAAGGGARWPAGDGAAPPAGVPVTDAGTAGDAMMAALAADGWPEDDGEPDPGVIQP
jgi:hypothetical protein